MSAALAADGVTAEDAADQEEINAALGQISLRGARRVTHAPSAHIVGMPFGPSSM